MKITLTADRLRSMVKAAYEDGHYDGHCPLGNILVPEDDWLESVAKSNLEDDIAAYRKKGSM